MRNLLLATTLLTTPALATDLNKAPVPAPVSYFDGFYVGLNAGYGWGQGDVTLPSDPVVNAFGAAGGPTSFNLSGGGAIVGGQAGYNWQYKQIVAGIETDMDWSGLSSKSHWDDLSHPLADMPSASAVDVTGRLNWLGTTRARFGVDVLPQWMIYGTGGVAYGGVSADGTLKFPPSQVAFSGSETDVGWTAGVGTEFAINQSLLVRTEYLHYDLGKTAGDLVRWGVNLRF